MLIGLLQTNPVAFVITALALVLSLAAHEFAHAYTADRLGDSTPRRFGRVTLNPLAHLDPFGTLLLLFAGFGFAKPVPVNPTTLGRWGTFWVSAAGPLSNLAIAIVAGLLLRIFQDGQLAVQVLIAVLEINVVLAVFNLIPIPLLDGSRMLAALFPRTLGRSLMQFEMMPYSFIVVMVFIYLARPLISQIINVVGGWVLRLVGF
ncbi:site-2 protease family protein [Deinococcus sonorensis]|uniref:Site-2 protease family protein n=2 Tax=Deinococcus sonorensis TaxID=309891 RepID=A0AAU7U948_9DEIO